MKREYLIWGLYRDYFPSFPSASQDCSGDTFIDCWTFFSAPDPTHGDVVYVPESTAMDLGLYSVQDDVVYLKSLVGQNGPAKSIRLQTLERSVVAFRPFRLCKIQHLAIGYPPCCVLVMGLLY